MLPWTRIESAAYWTLFVVLFLALATWESFRPKRPLSFRTGHRWWSHGVLLAVSGMAQTAVFRVAPVALAAAVAGSPFGILNRPWLPFTVRCALAVLLLDLTHYWTHRAFHAVPVLWRIHEVHHSDPDYDVSTAGRFHPLEVVAVEAVYLAVIAMLAPPVVAAFTAELLAVALNLFAHANVSLPWAAETWLRRVIVTPNFHRIHHSLDPSEQFRNLAQTFPWWDHLFGTYQAAAADEEIATGVAGFRNASSIRLGFMLAEPFARRGQAQENPAP